MNFYLNDKGAEFTVDNRDLKFYPNDRAIEFLLSGRQETEVIPGEQWVLSTGSWNDNEIWDDNGIWKDNP